MPLLPVTKLRQRLANGQVDSLYLLCGDETFLIQETIAVCLDHLLTTGARELNCHRFYADDDSLIEALSIARTLPMMATHRVVILHDIHKLPKAELRHLEAYAIHPSETTALICTTAESEPKKFPERLWRQALVIECKRLEGIQLRDWVISTIEHQGYTMTPEVVQEFLRDQQNDLWALAREIDKLCTYVGDTRSIRSAAVQAVCQNSQPYSLFTLTDAIGTRQLAQAFVVIAGLIQQGEPPLVVFSMVVRHLRLLWSVKQLVRQGETVAHIASTLHLPRRICRQLTNQSRQFSAQRFQRLFTAALEADVAFKTTNKPPQAILEGLVLDLCLGD